MTEEDVITELKDYLSREVLEGQDVGLDDTTPLFELGLLDSRSLLAMMARIRDRFGVDVPTVDMTPTHFKTLRAISQLVMRLR